MKNLENYGVQELDAKEVQSTDGGFAFLFAVLAGLTAMGIHDAIDYPDAFIAGLLHEQQP